MRRLWATREIAAPAASAWALLVDVDSWPKWGPSIRSAQVDGPAAMLHVGARGEVTTVVGVTLPFEITEFEEGRRWAWSVRGIPATDHEVTALGDRRCRVGIGLPLVAAPYLAVCALALRRIEALATGSASTSG
ncbi:MAG: SRPBCC family protein [Acidimicrobiia bacterium]